MNEIERTRTALGLRQKDVAVLVGLSTATIANAERKEQIVRKSTRDKILKTLQDISDQRSRMTNGDRVRGMEDEELVLNGIVSCIKYTNRTSHPCTGDCYQCKLDWLRADAQGTEEGDSP